MWMNGSRSAKFTPANARRTGKPSPSKPEGAVVMLRTGRMRASSPTTGKEGTVARSSTVTAGIVRSSEVGVGDQHREAVRPSRPRCDNECRGGGLVRSETLPVPSDRGLRLPLRLRDHGARRAERQRRVAVPAAIGLAERVRRDPRPRRRRVPPRAGRHVTCRPPGATCPARWSSRPVGARRQAGSSSATCCSSARGTTRTSCRRRTAGHPPTTTPSTCCCAPSVA